MSTINEYFESARIRGIDEGLGHRGVVQSMHATPSDGTLELMTGPAGPAGPVGESCRPFRWEGDIADPAALTSLATRLGPAQAGKAWRVLSNDTLMYWNGAGFDSFAEAFGARGQDGDPCTIALGVVETGEPGSQLQATIVGTAPNLTLNLTVPRGIKGQQGESGGPGPLRNAPDYADGSHVDGAVPTWDTGTDRWVPTPYPGLRGPWSVIESRSWDGTAGFASSVSQISSSSYAIATLNVPAQDADWRPLVTGGVFTRPLNTSFEHRVDTEVRLGSATGQIVALGSGVTAGAGAYSRIHSFFGTAITPGSSVGVVPAGEPVQLHVVLRRNLGSADYLYSHGRAQLICWAQPVATQAPEAPQSLAPTEL
ncbi:hypothetical protein ACFO5K_08245 [Nocardia halotolerans]|uniref:Minor tail protein n=1 Tax=Nocardia halotolerans TaxID=1755878 RepID=A0ABV8VGB6_9NOCA